MMSNNNTLGKSLLAVISGGVLEFYDLIIFGLLASTISPLFFPSQNSYLSLLPVYLTFAVGYFFRPLGSVLFGHIGDHYGRKIALYSCLLLMAFSTLAIGVMPTYASIGFFAPLLIIVARVLQGISAGGELAGGLIFIIEQSPHSRSGLMAGITWSGANAGVLLGSLMGLIIALPGVPAWGWRLAFIFGFFIAIVGLYIRSFLSETPSYLKVKQANQIEKIPLITGIKKFYKEFFCSVLITVFFGTVFFFVIIALPKILTQEFYISESNARLSGLLLLIFMTVMYPVFGWLADNFNNIKLAKLSISSLLFIACFGVFCLYIRTIGNVCFIFIYHIILGIVLSSYTAICQIYLIKTFKEYVRYSCFGTSYSIGVALSSTSPLFLTLFIKNDAIQYLFFIVLLVGLLAILSIFKIEKLKAS